MTHITPAMRQAFFDAVYREGKPDAIAFLSACEPEALDRALSAAIAAKQHVETIVVPCDLRERLAEVIEWRTAGRSEVRVLKAYADRHLPDHGDGAIRAAEDRTLLEAARLLTKDASLLPELTPSSIEWVANDMSELGVKIGTRFFFLYKDGSLEYTNPSPDDGRTMLWRPIMKREFGETCKPASENPATPADGNVWFEMPLNV